ncbi:ankyrin repeat domain protein [Wolbachia endosymbiont of Drosophila ananassae]|nr:ankyrin repeat domain protein [Wolbachia endosymbiont of Drosophila ananassae]
MDTGSVKYIAEPISEQSKHTDEQKLKCDLSAGQEFSEIGSPKTEATGLPVDSYYEFIKRDLFSAKKHMSKSSKK